VNGRETLLDVLSPQVVAALEQLVAERVRVELEHRDVARAWLTLEEAAVRYRTTPAALRKRAQRGTLPSAVRDGARWLVEAGAYDRALESGTLAATDNEPPHRGNGRGRGTGG
jgi:hypothetical protein